MIRMWLGGLVRHRGGRLVAAVAGIAAATALLASVGIFLTASQTTMTTTAIARVGVAWQVQVAPAADPETVRRAALREPGTTAALVVAFASVPDGLSTQDGSGQHRTGPAVVVGLPDGYRAQFPRMVTTLAGSGPGALLAQQTAANLHAAPGTSVTINTPGAPSMDVTGIVDLPQANALFQLVGAPAGGQPTAPPDNVLVVPLAQFDVLLAPLRAARPELVTAQVHVARAGPLPTAPAAAYVAELAAAHHLDAGLAGSGQVGDNLAGALDAARTDAGYATVLFLFLGLPGALLAATVTAAVAGANAGQRRRDYALLRSRGATAAALVRLAAAEATVVGLAGGAAGLGLAAAVGWFQHASVSFGATRPAALGWAGATLASGLVLALLAVGGPAWRQIRADTVRAGRLAVGIRRRRAGLPWVALGALVAGGLVWRHTGTAGYTLVLAPEGVAATSVDYWAFLAPALLWTAAAAGSYWLVTVSLARGARPLAALARPFTGNLAGAVVAALVRQRHLVAQTVTALALTTAFALSTATFNATYASQATVDARLTNGADVTATTAGPGRPDLTGVAGISRVVAIQHRYGYIGADLQDLYGVDTATIGGVGLQDTWFAGGTAGDLMRTLSQQRDGILVAAETVTDYQLQPGDRLNLRITGPEPAVTASFRYVGVVKEFPTAPRDSFFVANAAYLDQVAGSSSSLTSLITSAGTDPVDLRSRVQSALGPTATVTDISTTTATIGSSLTAVSLGGLTAIELGLAVLLTLAASGVLVGLTLTERRRMFTLATLLGASRRQVASFVVTEVAVVGAAGLALGAAVATLITAVLLTVLNGVFDPPPDAPTVPWAYAALLATTAGIALATAALVTVRSGRRPDPALIRRP